MLRVGGFLMVVPVFGNQLVSPRVRVALAFAIAMAIAPSLHAAPLLLDINLQLVLSAALQLLAGIGLGFAATVFFQLFVVAGQFLGMQMGLGFAALVDPGNGVQVTVWSQFFLMFVTLMFLVMNGHLVLLQVLIEGFRVHPLGLAVDVSTFAQQLAALGGWMFAGGVLIALPAVVALLVVNLAFGVMSRSAPQLNVFSLGFPFSLLFGLVFVWVALSSWPPLFERFANELFAFARGWTGT